MIYCRLSLRYVAHVNETLHKRLQEHFLNTHGMHDLCGFDSITRRTEGHRQQAWLGWID